MIAQITEDSFSEVCNEVKSKGAKRVVDDDVAVKDSTYTVGRRGVAGTPRQGGVSGQRRFSPALSHAAPVAPALAPASVSEKWNFFVSETATPLILVAAVPDAIVSQLTRSAPLRRPILTRPRKLPPSRR